LTGEGSYSGSKITVEILHTMFSHAREILIHFIEEKLFLPLCEKRGWFTEGKNDTKKYWYPKVGFNRLTIRDNTEVFESLFQLYQKGSLPVEFLYDLFNLDTTEIDDKLYKDLFTVRDPTFNEFVRGILNEASHNLSEGSNFTEKMAKYLKLTYQKPQEGGGMPQEGAPQGGAQDLASLVGGALGDGSGAATEESQGAPEGAGAEPMAEAEPSTIPDNADIEKKADEIAAELPSTSTPEEIMQKIVSKQTEWSSLTESEQNAITDLVIRELPPNATDDDIMTAIVKKAGGVIK